MVGRLYTHHGIPGHIYQGVLYPPGTRVSSPACLPMYTPWYTHPACLPMYTCYIPGWYIHPRIPGWYIHPRIPGWVHTPLTYPGGVHTPLTYPGGIYFSGLLFPGWDIPLRTVIPRVGIYTFMLPWCGLYPVLYLPGWVIPFCLCSQGGLFPPVCAPRVGFSPVLLSRW